MRGGGRGEAGPNTQAGTTSTAWNTREPRWGPQEAFHLCVYDAAQVVKIVLAHDMEGGAPPPPPPPSLPLPPPGGALGGSPGRLI